MPILFSRRDLRHKNWRKKLVSADVATVRMVAPRDAASANQRPSTAGIAQWPPKPCGNSLRCMDYRMFHTISAPRNRFSLVRFGAIAYFCPSPTGRNDGSQTDIRASRLLKNGTGSEEGSANAEKTVSRELPVQIFQSSRWPAFGVRANAERRDAPSFK